MKGYINSFKTDLNYYGMEMEKLSEGIYLEVCNQKQVEQIK